MLGCMRSMKHPLTKFVRFSQNYKTTSRLLSLQFKWKLPDNWKIEDKYIKQAKKKWREFKQNHYPPNDKDKMYISFVAGVIAVSLLIYELKKQHSEQISLQKMTEVILQSQTDQIQVNRLHSSTSKQINSGYILHFAVNGKNYHFITKSIEKTQKMIRNLQLSKVVKTRIIMLTEESFNQKLKKYIGMGVKIVSPLIIPVLLFRSSLGKFFTSNVLKQSEGLNRPNVLFSDIAGLGNAKIQVSQLVDFLRSPAKYKKIGARVPKGALLAGPPGTGKTMLAKACAGEASVPFFSMSGSEFVELFAGMGAKRVRQLFQSAKKQTPSIIFIDEIDAIGRKRQDSFGGGNDERANTLNQLLVQMDGFSTNDDIIVLAATNRKQMLDSALTRPGRFDRIVQIDLPDLHGRKEILNIYLNKIKLSPIQTLDEYSKRLATLTFGFSGADLANLCNQAAILAVRNQKQHVQPKHFQSASDRVLAGLELSSVLSKLQKKKVAYHESGHAVVSWFLEGASPLLKITIIPRSKGSLGFAQYLPSQSTLMTKQDIMDQLCVILGGRTSEQIFFNEITNGAADDLQKVRRLAREMIVGYGMSENHQNYAPVRTDGHNIFAQSTASSIDKEVLLTIQKATNKTRDIINSHKQKIAALAEAVLQKQTLNHSEIKKILGQRPFQSKDNYKQFLEQIKDDEQKIL